MQGFKVKVHTHRLAEIKWLLSNLLYGNEIERKSRVFRSQKGYETEELVSLMMMKDMEQPNVPRDHFLCGCRLGLRELGIITKENGTFIIIPGPGSKMAPAKWFIIVQQDDNILIYSDKIIIEHRSIAHANMGETLTQPGDFTVIM